MEIRGYLNVPLTQNLVPTEQNVGWVPEPVSIPDRRKKSLAPAGIGTKVSRTSTS
jgi:hypothetical protein